MHIYNVLLLSKSLTYFYGSSSYSFSEILRIKNLQQKLLCIIEILTVVYLISQNSLFHEIALIFNIVGELSIEC